jgi:hypothetical protein
VIAITVTFTTRARKERIFFFCQSCKSENLISFQIAGEEIFPTDQVDDAISHQMAKSTVLNFGPFKTLEILN